MRKVFLDDLPRWKKGEGAVKVGTINWNKCIGIKVPFIYGDLLGEIEIVDYINEGSRVIISYKGKQMNIFSGSQISSVCNGKRKHHKGFTFKYVENNE